MVFIIKAGRSQVTPKGFLPYPLLSKVIKMDLSNETIKNLFYKQIRELTLRKADTFDLQFSGKLLEK